MPRGKYKRKKPTAKKAKKVTKWPKGTKKPLKAKKTRETRRYKAKTPKVEVNVNVHSRIAHDAKVNPDHYARASRSGQQIIDVLEDFGVQNNAYRFVTVQYLFRAGRKSSETITDLLKARWYIDREIAHLERTTV